MTDIHADHHQKHFKFLDSARGIAALMVFSSHFIDINFHDKINVHYIFFLLNGNDAVAFFFVLSGFRLSYKYIVLNKPLDVKHFYVTRIFRLFPSYFLIVLLSALFANRKDLNTHTLSNIFIFDKTNFWEEAILIRFSNKYYYPGWTLTFEMLVSFLIPFYVALAIKNKKFIQYFIVVTLIIGNQIYYSYLFLLGVIISCNYTKIASTSFQQTKWWRYRYPILISAIILFSLRQLNFISPFGPDYKSFVMFLGTDFFLYSGIACFVFLVAIMHSKKTQQFLENRVLVFFGKISYGIYLVHLLVIDAIYIYAGPYFLTHGYNLINFTVVSLICTFSIILLAVLMHYCIELPFIRIGKKVVNKMKPSLVIKRDADKYTL